MVQEQELWGKITVLRVVAGSSLEWIWPQLWAGRGYDQTNGISVSWMETHLTETLHCSHWFVLSSSLCSLLPTLLTFSPPPLHTLLVCLEATVHIKLTTRCTDLLKHFYHQK
jgi:hypothetical protein